MELKVLMATKQGQGLRHNDFSHSQEGELVKLGFECSGEKVDGHCGCKRSLVGFDSLKATTTFKVVKLQITKEQFINRLLISENKSGYLLLEKPSEAVPQSVIDQAEDLLRVADYFKEGEILEKRGRNYQARKVS